MTEFIDTLVFYLAEIDENDRKDMQMYVLYDNIRLTYLVYGHRKPTKRDKHPDRLQPFSFEFHDKCSVVDFIELCIDSNNEYTYSLYALNGLPESAGDINFEVLDEFASDVRELAAFDNKKFSRKRIDKYMRVVSSTISEF